VVDHCTQRLVWARSAAVDAGELTVPADVSWRFVGTWEHKKRADARLAWLVPIAAPLVRILLHLQFRSLAMSLMVFLGVPVAAAQRCGSRARAQRRGQRVTRGGSLSCATPAL
jgi:Cu/Ag efflux pump CusA